MTKAQKYITPDELIERWGGAFTKGTLANQRSQNRPHPPFAKFGTKVLYPLDALEQWEAQHLANSNDNQPNENDE